MEKAVKYLLRNYYGSLLPAFFNLPVFRVREEIMILYTIFALQTTQTEVQKGRVQKKHPNYWKPEKLSGQISQGQNCV